MTDNITPLLEEYVAKHTEKKKLEAELKVLGEQVRPYLTDSGITQVGDHLMECRVSAGRKSLDKKAVAEAGIDLEPYYKVGAPFTTLTVKERK